MNTRTDEEKLNTLKKRQDKQNQYIKNRYDRVSIVLPKGYKELISSSGNSINAFVTAAVTEELKRQGIFPENEIQLGSSEAETDCPFS